MRSHPVRLHVSDDLRRRRLTVLPRLLLALPQLLWLAGWSVLAVLASVAAFAVTLARGRNAPALHRFGAAYVRQHAHVWAYLALAADPYPGFLGRAGGYPVDVEIDPPAPQRRAVTALRLLLALPASSLAALLAVRLGGAGGAGSRPQLGVLGTVALLAWFACLAHGRMPRGLRNLGLYAIRYVGQLQAYLLFLTDRYPDADPRAGASAPAPPHPVALELAEDDRRRPRLTVAFLLPLAAPHLAWLLGWTLLMLAVAPVTWLLTLALGRTPRPLHGFAAAYLRYCTHAWAFLSLVGGRFPGFTGAPGRYPVDLAIAAPAAQRRWRTALRWPLALPAALVSAAVLELLVPVAVFGWAVALVLGRMPEGLRRLGAYLLRYAGQVAAYGWLLLTERYPDSDPAAELPPAAA